jgi:hypothetical protein
VSITAGAAARAKKPSLAAATVGLLFRGEDLPR